MTVRSAGILLWRDTAAGREVWIAHMGGPFWARKDDRAWSIPKGEFGAGEDPLGVARREFAEEMGMPAPELDYLELGTYRYTWGNGDSRFPEVDGAEWTGLEMARRRLVAGQVPMLDDLPPTTPAG